jgi:hypothetical protein
VNGAFQSKLAQASPAASRDIMGAILAWVDEVQWARYPFQAQPAEQAASLQEQE